MVIPFWFFQFSPLPPLILPSSPIDKNLHISSHASCSTSAVFSPTLSMTSSPSMASSSSSSMSTTSSQMSSPSPSHQWSPGSSKENHDPINESDASKKKRLSVIAQHRRLGEESLGRLKEEVRRFAVDHTFKETAKKFGIHHSTVSGWVKAGEQVIVVNPI